MKALVVLIALVLAAPIGRAQGMSDLELSAAYCLAYANSFSFGVVARLTL